jgi:multidrug transporter EmrE-like cation transporter
VTGVVLVSICALIEGFAQVAFKVSSSPARHRAAWIGLGVALFIGRAVVYSAALRVLNVNVAYGVDALGFIAVVVLSKWLLKEHVTPIRWAGVLLILIGVGMIVAHA